MIDQNFKTDLKENYRGRKEGKPTAGPRCEEPLQKVDGVSLQKKALVVNKGRKALLLRIGITSRVFLLRNS